MTFPTAPNKQLILKWWNVDPKDEFGVAHAVMGYCRHLEEQETHKAREASAEMYSRLYAGSSISGLKPWQLSTIFNVTTRLQNNVVASCINSATARIASQRPAPRFLLNGADFDLRRKAPKLDKFGKGMLYQSRTYELGPTIFRDGCIFGTGISKIVGDKVTKVISNERVMPWDILVEDQDAYMGKPRTMTQRAYIDRFVLAETWPKAEDQIMAAEAKQMRVGDSGPSDQVVVYESWHLPSGPKARDGRHVIAIDGALLFQEEWERHSFPFAIFRWQEPIGGFWGQGIANALTGIQYEINTILAKIQQQMKLMGVTKVFLSTGAGTPKAHINNDIGAIITYNAGANPPTVIAPQSVHPELFQQVDRLIARAYAEVGLSEMSAESKKPVGLDSGKALREYSDIESERFIVPGRAYEQWFMDVVACALDEARAIPGFSVDVPDKNQQITIDWKDVDLKKNAYIIQCFPESILPQTPSGRTQTIEEWQRQGWITAERAQELLEIPDLEEAGQIATSAARATRSRVAAMLDSDAPYVSPEPYDDLAGALKYVNAVYLDEREKGCPEEKLELLRRYMNEIIALLNPPAPPAAQQQASAPVPQMPPGGPDLSKVQVPAQNVQAPQMAPNGPPMAS